MKKGFLAIICVLILPTALFAHRHVPLANSGMAGLYAKSIKQVLRLRENEVDLGTAALIVSENWSDMVYGRKYLSSLDNMAFEIRDRLERRGLKADFRAIPVVNEYLFDELRFRSISEARDPNSLFLHNVMNTKRGYCLSLSILYLSLAERLGLPLYGVVVPGHFFVRYDDKRVRFNIETTSQGRRASDEHYVDKFKVPGGNDSIYMKNLDKIQTLGCFFNNLGNSYNDIGDIDSALLAFERAIEINPTLSESRANLGNIYLKKGRVADAISEYQVALQINPNDAKTHNNLGNAYAQRNWLNYAVGEYMESLRLDPNFADAYKNLAVAYCKQEAFGQAITQLKRAIVLDPKDAACYSQLGDVYNQTGDCEQAISQYKRALRIDRDSVGAHYGMALCYNKLGMVDDEIWAYEKVLAVEPAMLAARVNLGNAYFGQKKYSAAIGHYKKAVRIQPDEAMIYYNLGAAYSSSNNHDQAVAGYLKAVELDPNIGDAHYGLAIEYYRLKKYDLAWKHMKTAQNLGVEVTESQLNAIKSRLR